MPSSVLNHGELLVDEPTRHVAAHLIAQTADEQIVGLVFKTDTGREVALPDELAQLLRTVIRRIAGGESIVIQTLPDVLTTSAAADLLGVSRPTLMKLIAQGELAAEKVGTHLRIKHGDVVKLREVREERQRASSQRLLTADI